MKKIYLILFLLFVFLPSGVHADESLGCDNRNLTIINPVRGRELWGIKSLEPIKNQYEAVKERNLAATWLLQFDAINDEELSSFIKSMDQDQELGLFLEVSEDLATNAGVIYPHATPWDDPKAIFLSGYSQSDRKRLINTLFSRFKDEFGFYPSSVGAWWIDSYSLNYMKEKYDIRAALIVADQQTTDDYGVWGQWWGVPYYPSKTNILVPAQDLKGKQKIVVLQWAQRDLSLAYGEGPRYSNYSLQANDYLERGRDIEYFKRLVGTYLDCAIPIGQITVGLETGMEASTYLNEYAKQLEYLKNIEGLKAVTMKEFAENFSAVYPEYPVEVELNDESATWLLSTKRRENVKLGDNQEYKSGASFPDYFIADKSDFLDRRLPSLNSLNSTEVWHPWFLLIIVALGFFAFKKKLMYLWVPGVAFAVAAFGLLLKSKIRFGWKVYYGPVFENLELAQILVVLLSFALVWIFYKIIKKKRSIWILPLIFGLTPVLEAFRYALFEGEHYFGVMVDALKFIGVKFSKLSDLQIIVRDLPSVYASSFLRIGDNDIWGRGLFPIIIYIMGNFALAYLVYRWIGRVSDKKKRIIMFILVVLFFFHLLTIISADPVFVLPA